MQGRFFNNFKWWSKRVLPMAFTSIIVFALTPPRLIGQQQLPQGTIQIQAAQEAPAELQQLVAPIALYPDALVAQILAASTYPTEVVQADRWLGQHGSLHGEQLAVAVDGQSWDPSVKALTAFPSVLANLDKNLSWTEALGGVYFNQQQDVLDAVQVMRQRAEEAGNLQSTTRERVVNEGPTIVIEPAYGDVCYLPIYDPWIVYGSRLAVYPGYFYDPWYGPPFISFGPAIGLGFFHGFGWGWPAWGFNWGERVVVFNSRPYISRSPYFLNRGRFIGTPGVGSVRQSLPAARVDRSLNNRTPVTPGRRAGNSWADRGSVSPGGTNPGRASFGGGGRSFRGGSRGGGSRGGTSRRR